MPEIRVVFCEVFDDKKHSEHLLEFITPTDPTYKEGDTLILVETANYNLEDYISTTGAEFADVGGLPAKKDEATHKIVRTSPPVIVYTMDSDKSEKSVFSKIYIYYLKKLEHKPELPLSAIAGMFR